MKPTHPGSAKASKAAPDTFTVGPMGEHLLPLLRETKHACAMSLSDWDSAIRLARQARTLGIIAHRLRHQDHLWAAVPEQVRGHLQAFIHFAAYRRQLALMEMHSLEEALPLDLPVALLKGAAYIAQELPLAEGRAPNDVDLLVRRDDLDQAAAALQTAGWKSKLMDAYDERYYREWSHELPPLRYPGHTLEVDLHHTIAPVTSRTRADDALLYEGLRPIPDSRYLVLHPQDQVLHAVIHLFQDSELVGDLRGLVDIDGLIRAHMTSEADWSALIERAARHKASRLLWYALHYCRCWLATPVPEDLPLASPPRWARQGMDWVFARSVPPRIPDKGPSPSQRLADLGAQVRYHRLRMPPALLARHLLHKSWVAIKPIRKPRTKHKEKMT